MIFVHDMSSLTYLQILGVAEFYGINPKLLQHFILSRNQLVNLTKITLLSLYQRILNLRHSIVFAFADFYNTHFQLARLLFDPDTTYLLDDGFSSFKAISTEINDGRFIPSDFWISNNTILSYLLLRREFHVYSIYSKYFQPSIHLDYCEILPSSHQPNIFLEPNTCIFIGTKLAERAAISLETEIFIMKKVIRYYQRSSLSCIYYAKRTSSPHKLDLLRDIGFEVLLLDIPFEIYLQKLITLPVSICGFGSTLFSTAHSLFPTIKYHFIDISHYLVRKSDILSIQSGVLR